MLPRFCKLCYQVVDESIIKLRRFSSVKHSNITSEEFSDEEYDFNKETKTINKEESVENPKKKVCIIKCKNRQYNFYEGDTFPKFQPIPLASRGWHHRKSEGDYFTIYPTTNYTSEEIDISSSFRDINLNQELLKNLETNNIIHPTKIQKLGIPKVLEGKNVILTAETGCGKTFAFLVPLIQQIIDLKRLRNRSFNTPLGLIITPSRELTAQIAREARILTKNLDINIISLTGGKTKHMINNPPVGEVDLMVATLGVLKKLVSNDIFKLDQVRHVVLDEADTLMDETFSEKLTSLLQNIPIGTDREMVHGFPTTAQLILNSATIPQNLPAILSNIVDTTSFLPIRTGNEHQIIVVQKFFRVIGPNKIMMTLKSIKPRIKSKTPIIIFANSPETCDFIEIFLKQFNIRVIKIHGSMPYAYRRGRFVEYQNGICNILVTTDAGARGLDTTCTKDVINYDMPLLSAEYIHRCGRIGRIGSPKDCKVINLVSRPLEIIVTRKIEFAIRKGKSIPMFDLNKDNNEEGEFINPNELTKYNDVESLSEENLGEDQDEMFPDRIPQ